MARRIEWDVVVIGGANTDYLVRGERLPRPGESVRGEQYQEAPGGKGANQAVAAARLGARVAFVARLGNDARGDEVYSRLRAEGVDTRRIARDNEAATGVAVVQVNHQGQKQILAAPEVNLRLSVDDIRATAREISAAKVTLMQLEPSLESVVAAARLSRESGAKVILDPSPAVPLPDELLRLIDVIKPNAAEAEELTGEQVNDRDSARRAAAILLERGVGAVAVEAGAEGNLLVWRDGEQWLPKLPVESVDATGAGDALVAALAVSIAEGRALTEAGLFANAAAALATTRIGAMAGLPKREAVMELLAVHGLIGAGSEFFGGEV